MFFKTFFSALLIVSLLGIGYFLFNNSEKNSANLSEEIKIKLAIENQKKENSELEIQDVKIVQQNSQYARAIFLNSENNFGSLFLVKIANDWQVVEMSETNEFFCEKMEKIGFPSSFIADCSLEFPKAEDVLTFSEKLKLPREKEEEHSVIGLITLNSDPAKSSFLLTSGEETIELNYDPSSLSSEVLSSISNGDQVLVNVQIIENEEEITEEKTTLENSSENINENINEDIEEDINENFDEDIEENPNENIGEDAYFLVVNDIQEINEDFFIPIDENGGGEEIDENYVPSSLVDLEKKDYDITDYQQEYISSRDYFFNFLDINNSDQPIHLIGN